MDPKSPSKSKLSTSEINRCKRILRICGLALVLALLIAAAWFAVYGGKTRDTLGSSYYTVVVDCGSTGTRINVYEWRTRDIDGHEMPTLENSYPEDSARSLLRERSCRYHCVQTEPGLDKFVGNISGLRASLEPLIRLAEKWVPVGRHMHTPIFVLATAGLRKLAIEDAGWVLNEVESIVSKHAFRYNRKWIRVLSGKEEAYYGWLALNFKMGRFGNITNAPTLGLLDLGGSSLQVVVEVDAVKADRHFMRSNVSSVKHDLLAYSLPELGINDAFDRSVVILNRMTSLNGSRSSSDTDTVTVSHPCLGSAFSENYTCNHCINNSGNIPETKFSRVYLIGAPNWDECKMLAKAVAVNSNASIGHHATAGTATEANMFSFGRSNILNLSAIAHPKSHFHALSGFFAVSNSLKLRSRCNLTELMDKGSDICSKSWDKPSHMPANRIQAAQYCFRVPYIASLFKEALHLGDTAIIFGPGDITWTLGAALVEGQYLWHSRTEMHTGISVLTNIEVIYSPLFVFALLMCTFFIVYRCQIKLPMPARKASSPAYVIPKRRPN